VAFHGRFSPGEPHTAQRAIPRLEPDWMDDRALTKPYLVDKAALVLQLQAILPIERHNTTANDLLVSGITGP
jgi:hypothetical protein